MMKVKFKLIITEVETNETYIKRQRNVEEKIIEKEFEINDKKSLELYEKVRNDDNIIERMRVAYELNEKENTPKERNSEHIALCYECSRPIRIEQEKEMELGVNDDTTETIMTEEEMIVGENTDQNTPKENNKESERGIIMENTVNNTESTVDDTENIVNNEGKVEKKKRKRNNSEENREVKRKKQDELRKRDKKIEKLIKKMDSPENESEKEIVEETGEKAIDIVELVKQYHEIEKGNRKSIWDWYHLGQKFEQKVEELKDKEIATTK